MIHLAESLKKATSIIRIMATGLFGLSETSRSRKPIDFIGMANYTFICGKQRSYEKGK